MIGGHLAGHLEYVKNGTCDDNHSPVFEFCDHVKNLNMGYNKGVVGSHPTEAETNNLNLLHTCQWPY